MSSMQIEIVAVTVTHVPNARGGYEVADIAYKNKTFNDKLEGKKVMSFSNTEVFKTLANASAGDVFDIDREKNDKGYWDWKSVNIAGTTKGEPQQVSVPMKANASPKSNYETPEERAHRQEMIVRQSSISSAVAALRMDKHPLPVDDVINYARHLEAYVMENKGGDNPFVNIRDELPV